MQNSSCTVEEDVGAWKQCQVFPFGRQKAFHLVNIYLTCHQRTKVSHFAQREYFGLFSEYQTKYEFLHRFVFRVTEPW